MTRVIGQNDEFISIKVGNYYVCLNNIRNNGGTVDIHITTDIDSKSTHGTLAIVENAPVIFINYGENQDEY